MRHDGLLFTSRYYDDQPGDPRVLENSARRRCRSQEARAPVGRALCSDRPLQGGDGGERPCLLPTGGRQTKGLSRLLVHAATDDAYAEILG